MELSHWAYWKAVWDIQNRHSHCAHQESNYRSWHRVDIHGRRAMALYDKYHGIILTFYPVYWFNHIVKAAKGKAYRTDWPAKISEMLKAKRARKGVYL